MVEGVVRAGCFFGLGVRAAGFFVSTSSLIRNGGGTKGRERRTNISQARSCYLAFLRGRQGRRRLYDNAVNDDAGICRRGVQAGAATRQRFKVSGLTTLNAYSTE